MAKDRPHDGNGSTSLALIELEKLQRFVGELIGNDHTRDVHQINEREAQMIL